MSQLTLLVTAEYYITRNTVTGNVTVHVRDSHTQRDYSVVLPEHLLPSLVDALDHAITKHPELFPAAQTRRVD